MKAGIMEAWEVLYEADIEKCPECHCCTGTDTEYKDFSCKNIATCSQCGFEWHLRDLVEA